MVEIARIGRQTTIRDLARSLFRNLDDAEGRRRAEAALVAANPGLAEETGFRPNAPVIVPTLAGAGAGRTDRRETADAETARAELARNLDAVGEVAADAFAREREDAKAAGAALRGAAVRAAMRKRFPDLADDLPALADLVEERAKSAASRLATVEAVIGQAKKDLATMGGEDAARK